LTKLSLITQNSTLRQSRHAHSKETHQLRVHQFTVQQVGKGGNSVIVINQVTTNHTELNPMDVHMLHYLYQLET